MILFSSLFGSLRYCVQSEHGGHLRRCDSRMASNSSSKEGNYACALSISTIAVREEVGWYLGVTRNASWYPMEMTRPCGHTCTRLVGGYQPAYLPTYIVHTHVPTYIHLHAYIHTHQSCMYVCIIMVLYVHDVLCSWNHNASVTVVMSPSA